MTTGPTEEQCANTDGGLGGMPAALRLSEWLGHDATKGAAPLWFDDGGRAWWGADELTGDHIAAWVDAKVQAERTRIAESMRGLVRLLHLPDKPQYPGDERPTEKRMLLALADATVADSWPNV